MATNSSRGNPIAASDGPRFDQPPPPTSPEVKADIKASSNDLAEREHSTSHSTSLPNTDTLSTPEAEQKREMEGLGRSEAAQRG